MKFVLLPAVGLLAHVGCHVLD